MNKKTKATSVRSLLIFLVILVIGVIGGGFYYGLEQVKTYAIEVNETSADAIASQQQVDELQQLERNLANSDSLIQKADAVFSTNATYESQVIRDTQRYAAAYNLSITDRSFPDGQSIPGIRTFSIELQSPVNYESFVKFLQALEGNLPKMQVSEMSINRLGDSNGIEITNLIIGVSTK